MSNVVPGWVQSIVVGLSAVIVMLRQIFIAGANKKIALLEKALRLMTGKRDLLKRSYQAVVLEKIQLILSCGQDKTELHNIIRGLEKIIDQLEKSFNWPEIKPSYTTILYDVSNIKALREIEFIRADARYNLFTKTDWVQILTAVHPLVKEALTRWEVDISDCDNWSTVMAAMVSIAFKKAGYGKQGAFAIAHTVDNEPARHAYNMFVTTDNKVWLYEPQNNTLQGLIQDGTGMYKTGYALFLS